MHHYMNFLKECNIIMSKGKKKLTIPQFNMIALYFVSYMSAIGLILEVIGLIFGLI